MSALGTPAGEFEPAAGEHRDWREFWADHGNCGGTWVYVREPACPRVICSCAMEPENASQPASPDGATGMTVAGLEHAIREASLLSDNQVRAIASLAIGWAEESAAERTRKLSQEHARHAVAVEVHKARADQQESRAVHAERALARFARYAAEYDDLAERAAAGQRAMDLEAELRRRIAIAERNGECYRQDGEENNRRLMALRDLARKWSESDRRTDAERTVVSATEAECGHQVLAIIEGKEPQ